MIDVRDDSEVSNMREIWHKITIVSLLWFQKSDAQKEQTTFYRKNKYPYNCPAPFFLWHRYHPLETAPTQSFSKEASNPQTKPYDCQNN
jgi:hypothetical protein